MLAISERAATLIKAAPDVIIAGPETPLRTLQAATRPRGGNEFAVAAPHKARGLPPLLIGSFGCKMAVMFRLFVYLRRQKHPRSNYSRTVPIVGMTEDMVAEGLVPSLARPGGNVTGISLLSPELHGKRQDING
jgi:hypothetical protein